MKAQPPIIEPSARGFVERDITLAEAARLLGHSPNTLRPLWDEIPTAYVSPGGRRYVNPVGLRKWLRERNQTNASNTNAAAATAASSAR